MRPTRRTFLGAVGLAGGALLGRSAEPKSRADSGRAAPAAGMVITRPNIKALDPNGPEIMALRNGVSVMKQRSADNPMDPTGWAYQANMHGVLASYYYWNQCKHGNWWFFPWHRLYLYYFERILRAASGSPTLALPYWHWDDPQDPAQWSLPVVFRVPSDGAQNPLYDGSRNATMNDPNQPGVLTDHDPSYALSFQAFIGDAGDGFGGRAIPTLSAPQDGNDMDQSLPHGGLERFPHDAIHDAVSGNMGSPQTAALDPIFWLHHANVDRLWKQWHRQGPTQNLDPTDDSTWMGQSFLFFDETGNLAQPTLTVAGALDTVTNLAYRYDDEDPAAAAAPSRTASRPRRPAAPEGRPAMTDHARNGAPAGALVASSAPGERVAAEVAAPVLGARPTTVTIALPASFQPVVARAARAHLDRQAAPAILLAIEGIRFDDSPGAPYGIYLNLPDPETAQPCPDDVHMAGTLSFFGLHHHPAMPALKPGDPPKFEKVEHPRAGGGNYVVNVTRTVRALKDLGLWDGKALKVTLIRHDPIAPGGKPKQANAAPIPRVSFQRISLRTMDAPPAANR